VVVKIVENISTKESFCGIDEYVVGLNFSFVELSSHLPQWISGRGPVQLLL